MNDSSHKDDADARRQRLDAAMLQRFDQELQEFRSLYDRLLDGERRQLRRWLEHVSKAEADKLAWLPMSVMIHTTDVMYGEDGDVVYDGHAEIGPHVMLKAVDAWDRGEDFLPASWIEMA